MPHAAPIRYIALLLHFYARPDAAGVVGTGRFKPKGICKGVLRVRAAIRAWAQSRSNCLDGIFTREGFRT